MSNAKFHILVGIDFSDSSNLAVQHAARMAHAMGARLHLAHIANGEGFVADTNLGMNIPADFPAAKESRTHMQRLLQQLGSGLDGEVHVRLGTSPMAGMLALIKEIKPDFVVVGSHGKGLLRRAFLGSVSNQLAARSPVPVMIIPTPGREEALNQPEPPAEPELPSVGHAVADSSGGSASFGVGSVGGGDINYR
jgi:nucleotide-binding universal stress UspA family protein